MRNVWHAMRIKENEGKSNSGPAYDDHAVHDNSSVHLVGSRAFEIA